MFCVKCGKENPESGVFCWSCGNKLFKDEAQAAPKPNTSEPVPTAMRNGPKLIVPRDAVLPHTCVKCGVVGIPRPYTFGWVNPGYFVLFFLGILPYFLVRLFVRKTVKLLVPLCEHHYQRARRLGIAAAVTLIASIPVGFVVDAVVGEKEGGIWAFLCSFFLIIAGLVLLWAHYPLQAVHIDDEEAIFHGANDGFLRLLSSGA